MASARLISETEDRLLVSRNSPALAESAPKVVTMFTLEEAAALYEQQEPRGEYVLVLEGRSRSSMEEEERSQYEKMSVREHVELYETRGMNRREAMKQAAKDRGVSKRDIYQELLNEDGDQD